MALVDWAGESVDWAGAMVDWAGALVDWAGALVAWAGVLVAWAGVLVDWVGKMVNMVLDSAGASVDGKLGETVVEVDGRAPLASGPWRESEGTGAPALSHSIIKSKQSLIGQRTFLRNLCG